MTTSSANGKPLRQTAETPCSADDVMELTTLRDVFAQPPGHRYCPVTVPGRNRFGSPQSGQCTSGWAVREGQPLGMVAGSGMS